MEVPDMKVKVAAFSMAVALLLVVLPVHGHHPFTAEFDPDKPVTLKGTVTKFEWGNPHATITMDGQDVFGHMGSWVVELGGPKKLKDFAWKKTTLKAGDQVTVNAWRARDGSNRVSANTVTLSNGTKMVGGSSFFEGRRTSTSTSN
jgi:hypothetical protein